jgi:hypothetical protein
MFSARITAVLLACLAVAGCGASKIVNQDAPPNDPGPGDAMPPADGTCSGRLNEVTPPLLTDATLACGDGMLMQHDVAAGFGAGYVVATRERASKSDIYLFSIGNERVVTEALPFWAGWARADGTGKLYLVGADLEADNEGVYTRDGLMWHFEETAKRQSFLDVDVAVSPGGACTILGSVQQGAMQQIQLMSKGDGGWAGTLVDHTPQFFARGFGALTLDGDLAPHAFFWRDEAPSGLFEWSAATGAVSVVASAERHGNIVAVRPAGAVSAVSLTWADGVHAIVDEAGTIRDVLAPGAPLISPKCTRINLDGGNSVCPQTCLDSLDGAVADVSALARTDDGRLWMAYVAGHFEQEVSYTLACGEGPCLCEPKVVRDATRTDLVVARVTPDAAVPVEVAWRTALAMPKSLEMDARGSELHIVADAGNEPSMRYLRLDTAQMAR